MTRRSALQHEHSTRRDALVESRPIRIAVAELPGKDGVPVLDSFVGTLHAAYRIGIVLAVEGEETDTAELAEHLRQLIPPSLVAPIHRETTAPDYHDQLTAALASLDAADTNLALILMISDAPTARSLLATGHADLLLHIGSPTATIDTRLSHQEQSDEQDERILVVPDTGEAGQSRLLAWLESHLERYRRAWDGQPGAERLRARSVASAPEQPTGKLPKYEYECKACETRFVIERPMSEASSPYACPFCGGPTRRIYSAPKLLFKADPTETRPIWHTHGVPGSANSFSHAHPDPRRRHGDLEERLRQKDGRSAK